ncbi:Ribonuclease H-like domain containing protein [Trema orientale]|uniref:Ribonuclease H-like domain containing protein n=1 Tax=Trema orientale TaxID=63057 RepID=A0A2P5BA60_TREOI|nr:Ribonuclease H-like domain containing protein [Trema orientale]
MNVDAAIPWSSDCFGVGVIIRDYLGGVIVAMAKRFPGAPTAFLAECTAFREGLKLTLYFDLVLEKAKTDVQNVVSAIKKKKSPLAIESPIINDISVFLSQLEDVCCSFVPRSGNLVAHTLANYALNIPSCALWTNEIPTCISNVVLSDLSYK